MGETKKTASQETEITVTTAYLILYNFFQTLGWSALLFTLGLEVVSENSHKGVYNATRWLLNIFQTAAILEVVHAALGLVRSNPVLTAFQVASRIFVTWGIAHSVREIQTEWCVTAFLLAWSVTEIIRYGYYTFSLIDSVPYFVTWCRYTLFIILYPIGVTGELATIYFSLPYIKKSGLYSIFLPNSANMSFDYYSMLYVVMASYIPIFPQLYLHMFSQRKKILGTTKKQV